MEYDSKSNKAKNYAGERNHSDSWARLIAIFLNQCYFPLLK